MAQKKKSSRVHSAPAPPESWSPARDGLRRVFAPVERFLAIQAASGIILMIAAAAALIIANSPLRAAYEALWHTPIGLQIGAFVFERDLHFWINDGLMAIFFFVVGLEIRREMYSGELSDVPRAALPIAAALGGMTAPAAIFLALNSSRSGAAGWAIPMATDIAFAVGVLALLGKRVPPALRILLLALAVIDDVGAIVVIALFYSTGLAASGFVVGGAGIAYTVVQQIIGIRSPWAYVPPALLVWCGAYLGGIHPTLAGVVLGLITPVRAWYGPDTFMDVTESSLRNMRSNEVQEPRQLVHHLDDLRVANREAVSPVERLQHAFHGVVAFGIMPLFAFANAGIPLGAISLEGDALWVFLGVTLGLIIGKPLGIVGLSWAAARIGMVALPRGIGWRQVSVVGVVGGIGFTMSLFIAQLAFPSGPLLETAKLAVLAGSGVAAVASIASGYVVLSTAPGRGAAKTESEAEGSTLT